MATSSSLSHVIHSIFPSFHGPDVRRDFLSHLHNVFARKQITMFDDQKMERCQTIGPVLIQAIRQAKASIVVLSRNYASSSCCLDELLEILKCKEDLGQIVMPIFYDVDPSDIRKQKGDFGVAFKKTCEGIAEEKKRRWIEALTCVATIVGEHSRNWNDEAAMLEKISTVMLEKLKMEKLWEMFRSHDIDRNGFINEQELRYSMTRDGGKVTDEEVRMIIKAADVDSDGRISHNEFAKFIETDNIEKVSMFGKFATDVTLSWDEKKEMIQWFRLLDVNQNGFITAADYQKYILTNYGKKVTDEDAHNFIKAFDVDCDGQVSYDEFVKLTR
ncbi:hypothetical protein BRARA_I01613 [Brassica rapa]|uniref:TIR domain-containing protein n=4 Tax=Brassica TaxID=3705 RepID=A0A397XUU9_BRACM|nr:disease resistance protein RML1A-like [Brassica rapa]XP_033135475.1 disease resistance protein RML1A-like [Brassica rapa]KAG5383104.1 hypothetical protein IGI04_034574 [Brassica rapa subsp. trilocularis]KAG5383105.1 hypothetical protein IGI04_034575 [Brassica rapa subsp. trilocularis]RID44847.1 hypothetical protein BRARA_I01613 [Brassica rapa]